MEDEDWGPLAWAFLLPIVVTPPAVIAHICDGGMQGLGF